tara:strand:+ start:64695 stop:67040 length:2346 start_codon:yes stop_codon:yes gene_type:complete
MPLPQQKVSHDLRYSTNAKGLNNIEETAEHYLAGIVSNNDEDEILRLYRMLEDYINEEDYKYILNPFNTKIEKYTRFRGRLRNFNIVAPVIEMLLSEFGRRNHYPRVMQTNPNDDTDKEQALNAMYKAYSGQVAINELNKIGVDTGQESQELPTIDKSVEEFERTYTQERVITGQQALDYLIVDKDLADKYIELYRNYLVCGRPITYKGVNHNDVHFEIVHPFNYFYPESFTQERLEDRDWGIHRWDMSINQFLDYHRGHISTDLMDRLKDAELNHDSVSDINRYSGFMYMSDEDFNSSYKHYYKGEERAVEHYHIVFKAFKRVATLTYVNPIGETKEMEVEDTYKLNEEAGDVSIAYDYKNALYETYKVIFNGHEEYVRTGEIVYDRAEVNNSSKVKLPYNGLALTNMDGGIKSLVKSSINYQSMYNILKFSFEKLINKNKDKIAVIPLGLLNKGKQGWDEEKAMYYAEANSTLFIDETSPTASLALQGIKVLDMSLGKYAGEVIQLADQVKNDWWDSVGFNRQRYGETQASDGKATTEQAIFRSSLISENLIRKFEKFQEKDYAGLLDLTKYAWIDGVKGTYINSQGAQKLFELNADNFLYYLNSDMDVHVIFSGDENKKIEDMKGYMFNATQNGMSMKPVLEAMDAQSFTLMKEIIMKEEDARLKLEQANKEAELASAEGIEASKAETKKLESADKRYVADKNYDAIVDSTQLKENINEDEADSLLQEVQATHKMELDEREQNRKEGETATSKKKTEAEVNKLKKETNLMKAEVKSNN